MLSFDSEIQDQAYQFFVQEAAEFLQILETGLMELTQDHSTPRVHELMRAAHSIKGGAASVGLESIKQLAYQLEDCLRALYQDDVIVDTELEDLLLQAFDCLQEPLREQIETGEHSGDAALKAAEPVYVALVERLGEALERVDTAVPTSAELGIDIVQAIFSGDVQNGLDRIAQVLANPEPQELVGEIRAQAEVFVGVGELVNLPGWVAIAKAILTALQHSPDQVRAIADVALENLKVAQQAVLDGDRVEGGVVSEALQAFGSGENAAVSSPDAEAAVELGLPDDDPLVAEPLELSLESSFPVDEMANAVQIAAAETTFEAIPAEPYNFDEIPTEQLDELFGLAMEPSDIFDESLMAPSESFDLAVDAPEVPPELAETVVIEREETLLGTPEELAETVVIEREETPSAAAPDPLLLGEEPTFVPQEEDASAAVPQSEAVEISDDDFANLDAFFDLALSDDSFDLSADAPIPTAEMSPPPDRDDVILLSAPDTLDTSLEVAVDLAAVPPPEVPVVPVPDAIAVDLPEDAGLDTAIYLLDQAVPPADTASEITQSDRAEELAAAFEVPPPTPAAPAPLVVPAADAPVDERIQYLLAKANQQTALSSEPEIPRITEAGMRTTQRRVIPKAAGANNVVRVDLARLEQINNLVGSMVTQENTTMLQNRQLQATAKSMLQRFQQFEKVARQIGAWSDRSQRDRANFYQQQATPTTTEDAAEWQEDFDPLQMDTYGELYSFAQEMLELMSQMDEGMRDITQISKQAVRSQQQQQQILKQVRTDLLWARMLPLGDLLQRFPRMMRDLSNRYGKPVKLDLSGTHTLVDKSILQSLYDPMVHLLRNAFDHGIEPPEDRILQDKPAQAKISVRAYHRGNQTYIEIADDGRGIDPERIRQKVIDNALAPAAEARTMRPEQLYQYIFAAGFSTAGQVSELSGRGVGLDAVKTQVTSLKGNVSVSSALGEGTTFTIQLPLTLTVAHMLVFTIKDCLMAAPIDALKAIISVPKRQIQMNKGRKVYYWDDEPVPLCPRSQFLHAYPLPRQLPDELKAMPLPQENVETLLLIETPDRQVMALAVDQILQEQELAIKPFSPVIKAPEYFYGCTILGNGLLVPVLDMQALTKPEALLPPQISTEFLAPEDIRDRSTMTGIAIDRTPVVLVVDDSLTARQTLALTLQKAGYRVLQAKDGREGLEQVEREPLIKAVFSDVEMPRMNGFEFLAECRRNYTKEQLPIIMLTSRGGDKHRQIAKFMGANAYLTKPYLSVDVLSTLEECLPQKQ